MKKLLLILSLFFFGLGLFAQPITIGGKVYNQYVTDAAVFLFDINGGGTTTVLPINGKPVIYTGKDKPSIGDLMASGVGGESITLPEQLGATWYFSGLHSTITTSTGAISHIASAIDTFEVSQSNSTFRPLDTGGDPYTIGDYDGSNDLLAMTNDPTVTGAMTISIIVKGVGNASQGLIGKLGDSPQRGWLLGVASSGIVKFYIAGNATTLVSCESASGVHITDEWVHYAAVFSPSNYMRIYQNGVMIAEKASGVNSSQYHSSRPVQIGSRGDGVNNSFFDGYIDEVSFYETALDTSDIRSLYNDAIKNVLIVDGQSNASGRALVTEGVTTAYSGLSTDNMRAQTASGLQAITVGGTAGGTSDQDPGDHGIELSMMDEITNQHCEHILLHEGEGGRSLADWFSVGQYYHNQLLSEIASLKNTLSESHLNWRGYVWIHGESDALDLDDANAYETNLDAKITDLRSEISPSLRVVMTRLSSDLKSTYLYDATVNTAMDNIASGDGNAFTVNTDAIEMQSDSVHYTSDGYIELGGDVIDAIEQ